MTEPVSGANPYHAMPREVAEGLERMAAEESAVAARREAVAKLVRPGQQERDLQLEIVMGRSPASDLGELRERSAHLKQRRLERLEREDLSYTADLIGRVPIEFAAPEPVDTSFWFADFTTSTTPPYAVTSQADGLHFTGKKTSDSGSLQFFHYGVRSRYGISANRIPPSSTGRWRSAPHVELFGAVWGYTGSYDIFDGDSWSKCWMIRRQTLTQFLFGPTGPVPRVIGEATEVQNIINEENRNRHVEFRMPGFQWMPAVVVNHIFPGLTVWAELEVRFDIQLEGTSFHWIHPGDVLLRLFQWPLLPNA